MVPCGVMCTGSDTYSEHVKICVECGKVKLEELQNELNAIKKNNDTVKTKLSTIEDENMILREELKKYSDTYGVLEPPEEDDVEEDDT
jgi:septation ring formation regulator EzrA